MKKAQIAVLGVALASGGAAWWLMSGGPPPPPTAPVVEAVPSVKTVGVLVAQRDMPMGVLTTVGDFRWQEWPADNVPERGIRQTPGMTAAPEEVVGAITRQPIVANEPILKEKILKMAGSGFMSALLPQGYRAVAINIDATGSSTAGGFILPNDRVDVIRVMRDESARSNEYISETILQNVRVLAIGQALTDKSAQGTAVGSNTATLELSPRQVEQIVSAQRMGGGTLTLALRSALDVNRKDEDREDDSALGLQVVRFGQSSSR